LNITVGNTYDFAYSNVNYLTGIFDYRKYYRLTLRSAYAIRLFTMFNEGKEARYYYMGGSWDLRLYRRLSLYGQRQFLISQELRFPLFDAIGVRLPFGTIGFSGIRGAVFLDAGNAWTDRYPGLIGSFGVGFRMRFANYLVLRLDIGRRTDFKTISNSSISQFFFGWDF
jgi:outer membrane protein assembly factor BamA